MWYGPSQLVNPAGGGGMLYKHIRVLGVELIHIYGLPLLCFQTPGHPNFAYVERTSILIGRGGACHGQTFDFGVFRAPALHIISSFQKVCDSLGGPATEETLLLMSVCLSVHLTVYLCSSLGI